MTRARAKRSRAYHRAKIASLGIAGLIDRRLCRKTKTEVGIYKAYEAGMEIDPETPYCIVCEEHGSIVSMATLRQAREFAPDPTIWCDDCREAEHE